MGEKVTFFKSFLKSPREIGSIIPSSNSLSKMMIKQQNLKESKCIIELGPGVGCFTTKIIQNKKDNTPFYVFEQNKEMQKILSEKFKGLTIYNDANDLSKYIESGQIEMPDTIISGLPFTSLKKELRYSILKQVYNSLRSEGKFITFQYSLHLLKHLKSIYTKVEVKIVPLNIPMAYVYVCTK